MSSSAVYLNELGVICALGADRAQVRDGLFAAQPGGLRDNAAIVPGRTLALGEVHAPLSDLSALPVALRGRNNGLLDAALEQIRAGVAAAVARFGAERVAVIIGTSTSGIGESENALRTHHRDGVWPADFHYAQQEMGTAARFVRERIGSTGPAWTISTACSSSAKALMSAARLLQAGAVDAVVAGGADSMCRFTVAGFSALESVSAARCNPFSVNRNGINIGEGAALFLMTREPGPVRLSGWGESSDAHHMSAPDPQARGAIDAMQQALDRAGLTAAQIDYVNLHGTATGHNDAMESQAVAAVLGTQVPASSTKPLTGHTLGASGAIEAALCWMTLADNPDQQLPTHWWDGQADDALPALALVAPGTRAAQPLQHVLSHSFAFGGSNAVLALAKG
ncbi:3-oxoacyl-[acyl-carrier-protein] synthase-1 [Stenotrophomonas rhizophila]|uniref:beta-ketoacyl-[acyl-carrier-protein] synthase family protein n=1 Tax=Stenotrophomonas TaxID=40323 RepID=UPI000F4CE240|nr:MULTISPECIES: beta-ketoacyl-[acyl-carrier-protein] synthase family protein [Stenotrophomonas]MCW6027604.1 beta-ketoacyl-[acyl-carrier-protein] synthase family protein [Stenotrophomonas sp. SRS1]ROP76167.1 3-oxoacyl-[acyl-carrier-protein] synthase-1 [Stenotrophomonas rhizophila]